MVAEEPSKANSLFPETSNLNMLGSLSQKETGEGRRSGGGEKPFDLFILLFKAYKFLALNKYQILFSPVKNFLSLLCPILTTLCLHYHLPPPPITVKAS